MNEILKRVCEVAGITEEEIKGRSKECRIVIPRHVFVHYAVEAGYGKKEAGIFINRTYSTAIKSFRIFEDLKGRFRLLDEICRKYLEASEK
jgi:chromosomal replication initiation ATPase DnaA